MATPEVTTPRGLVAVTGGSGYIAGYCIARLLNEGWRARTTVRNLGAAEEVRATIGKITANSSAIEFMAADLNSDTGWADAVAGADYVLHVASPVPTVDPKSDDELVRPARDGTLRVLKAARDAGVKRVVMTSSISAIMFGRGAREKPFAEADWTDETNRDDTSPYDRAKTIAERAAWAWHKAEGGGLVRARALPRATPRRGRRPCLGSDRFPVAEHPPPPALDRLAHEYGLKDELDAAWAARPLDLVREGGRTALLLEDPGGEPLERLLGEPMETGRFLRLAIDIAAALGRAHQRGLVHKDVKPANILVNCADGGARLTGFGVASRLPRQRQAPEPPEIIAGTLAYMAPEQTGRMNRSIDSRTDLCALGVTFYRMLTGRLPFTAADPMEWVHCHIAHKPTPPAERSPAIPTPISDIVLKLIAKPAEERHQTAAGLEHDLRHCLEQWEAHGRVEAFSLGERDMPDRLVIPEKLYGREPEVEALLAAFDRVVGGGQPELVLVSGYSGTGKSSVVNELHKALVPPRGLFASGKFDQLKRDIPYATLVHALQSLIRPLLSRSDAELARWREAFQEALAPNGRLIVDLVPELKLVVGELPPVPELELQQAQSRFQLTMRRFIGVFARPERPLALFLDDLQWLDTATLDLIEDVLTQADVRDLMLIGAYRDNEVDAAHPLARKLAAIRSSGAKVSEIKLAPLQLEHVRQLIVDALHCDPVWAEPLAQLVYARTGGNPFFAIQFFHAFADEGLLAFDPEAQRWNWDLQRIHAKGYADNVVDLMVGKLARAPPATRRALEDLACLGNLVDNTSLAIALGASEGDIHAALWDAVRQELVERLPDSYRFVHDRVQEAAYALIPEGELAAAHLRIGRRLVAETPPEKREERIFEIVGQLNRAAALIAVQDERENLAELNLIAGKRAKAAAAHNAALMYFTAGRALLEETGWRRCYRLTFELELNSAECEYLLGDLASAEKRLAILSTLARGTVDSAAVTCLRINLYTTLDRSDRAVAVGLDYLRRIDGQWSLSATAEDVRQEYDRLCQRLGSTPIEGLLDMPPMRDPDRCATMDVLTVLTSPALFTDNLFRLVVSRMASLSLGHGNNDGSCLAYTWLGGVLGTYLGEYQAGFSFGRLGLDLVEKHGLDRFRARVYLVFAVHVAQWTQPLQMSRAFLRRAFEVAKESGDLSYAAYSRIDLVTNGIATSDLLSDVEQEANRGLEFARRVRFGLASDCIAGQLQLIRMLRGQTANFTSFNDAGFDEGRFEERLENNPQLAIGACWYWIRKLQAGVYANDDASAITAMSKVAPLMWTAPTQFELAEYHFFGALARAAHCDLASAEERPQHLEALADHYQQLVVWAKNCPATFANRAALVGAEIARLEGRELDALRLYEEAIRLARDEGFIQNEGLAHERAAWFCGARNFQTIADAHLKNARRCFMSWGADGKVRHLDQLYPHLSQEAVASDPTATVGAAVERLDLATVIKVSQAVSGEIVLEKLLETLMRAAIEHAGAERGLLIAPRGDELQIEAEATTSGEDVTVHLADGAHATAALPESLVRYVVRTEESVILDDASSQNPFSADPYIVQRRARSILCLPLINQAKLIRILFLENNLTRNVFTRDRVTVLKVLASQAAISLENSRLYRDLEDREGKIRRLVDSNIIGVFVGDFDGRILEANDAFLRIVGYDREDLAAGRMNWKDLTPRDWRERNAQWIEEHKRTGVRLPIEKEYFRKDGRRVPILLGSATVEEGGNQTVTFVLDLTERKRAEAEARESERRYREAQMQLAHANRVATMGQLTASIAHEVNQPIAATVLNAETGLRWLDAEPPNLDEARQAFGDIVRDGNRAAAVVHRIRNLSKKAPARDERVDISAVIHEVIELTRSEVMKNSVLVQTQLAEGLPLVQGDRVELQQVILNLIVNAVEAMSDMSEGSRELLITTGKTESDDVLVAVRDSGPGLAPDAFERLFEGFYTTKPSGLGLGLSICRSILEGHGGRLWTTANSPRGAVFQFTLPFSQDVAVDP